MKLTKLLPMTTIASILAITTPIVASCSCTNPDQPDPPIPPEPVEPTAPFDCAVDDATGSEMTLGGQIIESQEISFEADTEYTFTIDFSGWENFEETPNKLKIMGNPTGDLVIVSSITSVSIWFDHEKWVEGTDYQIVEDITSGFTYVDWSATTSEIKKNSILTGRFKVSDRVDTACLLTHFASE